ncbi:hypothetical protein FPOAC2_09677 [Fusarium poae]|uniref:hypothetical protein n=1 Tax=Fusarium poae TaxID=36050 RepID=UPI001CEA4157|nr:hypothetical protein FPOAC1_009735 [Fusarium poae]KAG8670327.1 hypothetical protein FPOAC1_009735 [Fusarium poae]
MSNPAERMLRLDMALTANGTPNQVYYTEAGKRRGNRRKNDNPTDIVNLVPPRAGGDHRLWITDRIMEPQTIPHFIEFLMHGCLPGDRKTSQPLLTVEETRNMSRPFPEWAPAPFKFQQRSTSEWLGIRIGSHEDSSRLWLVAKEVHAMKSRLWEGIPPLSERRWKELQLDDPRHFGDACQYFMAVIDVFAYLNHPRTKNALRTTYNLIWGHLRVFEQAINAKRKAENDVYEEVSVTGLWYQYIRAHYDCICDNAHQWVISHINRIREPLVLEIASHQPSDPEEFDARQLELADLIHDLGQNTVEADYIIFMPTDGYKGDSSPAKEHEPLTAAHKKPFREEPISWSANINGRGLDYIQRVRYLTRKERYYYYEREGLDLLDSSENEPGRLVVTCISQIDAQTTARLELRGPSEPRLDRWIEYAQKPLPRLNGFAAFRLCHKHDDKKWNEFKTKFEADIADWGLGKKDIDDVRKECKIHWIDGKQETIKDAKRKFYSVLPDLPVHHRMFLAIDEATIQSYLEPNSSKFVLAVDAQYGTVEEEGEGDEPPSEQDHEVPGYNGTVRILGSLLWDELGAMQTTQGVLLKHLWPYAMSDVEKVYRGYKPGTVLKFSSYKETAAWEVLNTVLPVAIRFVARRGGLNS